jgi:hypothetical protein
VTLVDLSAARDRLGYAEVLRMLADQNVDQNAQILEYLKGVAESFTADEAFSVMTLVDTPDVFD